MAAPCVDTISSDGGIPGEWASGCKSQVVDRGHARYFTFSLDQWAQVTIDLESSVDLYLYLSSGTAQSTGLLHENDDVEPGVDTDSRIAATLSAGSYTIEATTYCPDRTGVFTLTISGLDSQSTAGPETGGVMAGYSGAVRPTRSASEPKADEITLSSVEGDSGPIVTVSGGGLGTVQSSVLARYALVVFSHLIRISFSFLTPSETNGAANACSGRIGAWLLT